MKVLLYLLAFLCSINFVYGATGTLVINDSDYVNPKGCYRNLYAPLVVINHANAAAYVFKTDDCTGPSQVVQPANFFNDEAGHSVQIS
ncbi:hypothetical protein INT44_007520 [Umbelopsis vinacea]|uniref:Uncharacterized protein n=1 Tax=Umbelopsis vinacea TaxID=44442 RepID=A0A8H7U940_9FUNG|nr:hypothetical protein INT44_007520 [Umbelopsis vinacea]